MLIPLAHSGHWTGSLPFTVPIIGFALWLIVTTVKERRRERAAEEKTLD